MTCPRCQQAWDGRTCEVCGFDPAVTLPVPPPPSAPLREPERPRPAPAPPRSAPYYRTLPDPPVGPDLVAAGRYLEAIRAALEADASLPTSDPRRLTRGQRATLHRLERTWARRVAGDDPRWLAVGTKAGRITRSLERTFRRPDPAWEKP